MTDQALPMPTSREAWMNSALCTQVDPEIFFPDGEIADRDQGHKARKVCFRCPVSSTCLDYALAHHPLEGIWAGTSRKDRDQLLREAGTLKRAPKSSIKKIINGGSR